MQSHPWTKFLEFKPNHMFECILDRQGCTPTFTTFQPILTPLIPTLLKPHDVVSLSSSFLEFKFDHKFGCQFDQQVRMQTFETFQNIVTPFNPNLSKTAQQSFRFH